MDTLHGPLILAITYLMAGAGAVLAPMLAASAATSIGGIGGSGRHGVMARYPALGASRSLLRRELVG